MQQKRHDRLGTAAAAEQPLGYSDELELEIKGGLPSRPVTVTSTSHSGTVAALLLVTG
jgi:hypothetical protein